MTRAQRQQPRDLAPSPASIGARIPNETAIRLAATSRPQSKFRGNQRTHTDDIATDKLATAIKARFVQLRAPGFDWDDPRKFSPELLAGMLGEAICAGDVVLVGAIAATLHSRITDAQAIAEHAMRAFLRGSCHDQAQRIAELQAEVAKLQETSPETCA